MNNDYVHVTQWAFNPSAYQNMSNDEVDWATLAQQWIKMKEACPQVATAVTVPPPPPPLIGPTSTIISSKDPDKEEGEAPMEMDNGKDDSENSMSAAPGNDQNWGQWGSNWNQWSWGWGQVNSKAGPAPPNVEVPAYARGTNAFPPAEMIAPPTPSYNQEYWSSSSEPYTRSKGDSWGSSSRRGSSRRRSRDRERKEDIENSEPPVLDAAKRRSLPAWIREGLEKMEREKQKKIEQDHLKQERQRLVLENANRELHQVLSDDPKKLMKSKFDSDSESEANEEKDVPQMREDLRKSRFDETSNKYGRTPPFSEPPPVMKSKEQIMEETMLKVRRVLTQILMEVTTHEMEKVVNHVHSVIRKKAPATRLEKTQQLSGVTSKLGLGIYDSDSDSSSENEDVPDKKDGEESDRELKERIMRKRKDFQKVEREIDYQIEQQEEKERRVLAQEESEYSNSESDADESVDTRNTSSKELEVNARQQDAVNKGQVHPSNQPPDKATGEKSRTMGENHKNEVHENRVLSSKIPSVEKVEEKSASEDSDSYSSSSASSGSSSSSSSSSKSSSGKHSKSKLKSSKKERKERSRSKRSFSRDDSRSYSRRSGKRSVESQSSLRSKKRNDRSLSRESKSKASSKKRDRSSERSSKRYQFIRSHSGSSERKRYRSRSHSGDRQRRSRSRYSHKSSSRSRGLRSSSRYSRSPSSKYSHSSKGRSKHDKSKRSHHSDSSPDSYSGDKKRSRR